ncbi:MAG TPA: NADH:flavin oxidoreductase [Anaerolineae bacterium]|nr:NADH:flavin oxidoreductase [Anaerolineae bacterium]
MSKLFEPAVLGRLQLRNRIVKSGTLENMGSPEGLPSDATLTFYQRLARGGAGLLVTGLAYVSRAGKSYMRQHGIHNDGVIAAWRRVTEAVQAQGAAIALQLAYGGRQTHPAVRVGGRALSPSTTPSFLYFTLSRSMREEEILSTIQDFGAAAGRAKQAGFDAVQIHAGHGYLISSFLSPLTNRRRDAWGGDRKRRFRFLGEVYRAVRQNVGDDFPVLCKLNVDDYLGIGLRPSEAYQAAQRLNAMGLDGLEITGGVNETALNMSRGEAPIAILSRGRGFLARLYFRLALGIQRPWTRFQEAFFLDHVRRLKPSLSIPLFLVGGIRRLETAERVLKQGWADFISLARPLIREPGLPMRWKAGDRAPAQCESCNRCLGEIERGNVLKCYSSLPSTLE